MNLEQIIARQENSFFEDLAIRSRFNPKEPIYGEENRQDLERLKIKFSSSIKEILEGVKQQITDTIGINTNTSSDEVVYVNGIDKKEYINKLDTINHLEEIIKKL